MVFRYFFAEEDGFPFPFREIPVYWPVEDVALFVVIPVLAAVSREDGVFYREHECAAGGEATFYFRANIRKRFQVMEGKGTDYHVVAFGSVVKIFDSHASIFDLRRVVAFPGFFQHFFGDVDSQGVCCTLLDGVLAMPSEAAPEVEYPFAFEVGKHFLQNVPFACAFKSVLGTGHLAVLVEEFLVVVFVFFHGSGLYLNNPLRLALTRGGEVITRRFLFLV